MVRSLAEHSMAGTGFAGTVLDGCSCFHGSSSTEPVGTVAWAVFWFAGSGVSLGPAGHTADVVGNPGKAESHG